MFDVESRRVSTQSDVRGAFTLRLPDKADIASDSLHFLVSAPSGETIVDTQHSVNAPKAPFTFKSAA